MNLIDGKIADAAAAKAVLDQLEQRILCTLSRPRPAAPLVIEACDRLAATLDREQYLAVMAGLGISRELGLGYLKQAEIMFSGAYLRARLERELGRNWCEPDDYTPPFSAGRVTESIEPLGVLLHIAAGNVDGLPAFSVLEGLLTGNINILKLPEVDGGVSVMLLSRLVRIQPALAEYIYVFDYSSRDTISIGKLIRAADGVVVWGGDAAVSALRQMVPPEIRLIEWGHKLSFAYATPQGINEENLTRLARGICRSNQLLCSSCQGLYLDTGDMEQVYRLCKTFLPLLERESARAGVNWGVSTAAQVGLQLYNASLESLYQPQTIYRGQGVSLIASADARLEPAIQFRNCWVKPLPRRDILATLRPHKQHLQTVGLLAAPEERQELMELLRRSGAVRISDGNTMSAVYCGAAHDGEYPLRRYTRVVAVDLA